jgi:hypothetical protein
MSQPRFQAVEAHELCGSDFHSVSHSTQSLQKSVGVDDSQGGSDGVKAQLVYDIPVSSDSLCGRTGHKGLPFPLEDLVGDNSPQGPTHQGTPLAGPQELLTRNGVHELQQVPIKVGIARLIVRA